jgi:hypothetical protein
MQVDEPALREGLPLKREQWESYLKWAVNAFRLSTAVAAPQTQIVTHLCYSEFGDILPAIDGLDGVQLPPHVSTPALTMQMPDAMYVDALLVGCVCWYSHSSIQYSTLRGTISVMAVCQPLTMAPWQLLLDAGCPSRDADPRPDAFVHMQRMCSPLKTPAVVTPCCTPSARLGMRGISGLVSTMCTLLSSQLWTFSKPR